MINYTLNFIFKKRSVFICVIFLQIITFIACEQTPRELATKSESTKSVYNGIKIQSTARFLPNKLVAQRDYAILEDTVNFEKFSEMYAGKLWFELSLINSEAQNNTSTSNNEVEDYWNFGIKKDIYLVHQKDTIYSADLHLIHGVKNTKLYHCVFNFDVRQLKSDLTLMFHDKQLGLDAHQHHFKRSDLN